MAVCRSAQFISSVNDGRLFPLPLAPMEEYLLLDDSPAYPMNLFGRFHFSGVIDRAVFMSVLPNVFARHPLLTATIKEGRRGRFQWIAAKQSGPFVQWFSRESSRRPMIFPAIDIRAEPGLRVYVIEGDQTTDLIMQSHHVCFDGLGALQFTGDLLTAYASALEKNSPDMLLRPLDRKLLFQRATFGLTPWKFLRMAHKQAIGLLGARQFIMRSPAPLIPHQPVLPAGALPADYPAALTRRLAPADLRALREAARKAGATINDLLLRDLFLALDDWRIRHGQGNAHEWLRLSVPMNLRTVKDRQMPATNVVSMVFLDRRPAQFGGPRRLLESINEEMNLIKRLQLGLTFVLSLRVLRNIPGMIPRMVRADRCRATSVMTNLGKAFSQVTLPRRGGRIVVGNVVLEEMELLAPIHPYTCATFVAFIYAHRLCISLHYDSRVLSPDGAKDLLDTYMQFLRTSAQSPSQDLQPPFTANK